MSQEHENHSPSDEPESSGIRPEPPPFEQGYQPESLPKITVPDLPADAQGLSAEALSQVPTLTELVHDDNEAPIETPEAEVAPDAAEPEPVDDVIQEAPVQADTWTEVMHARMGKLTDEIHTLNTRLDRLEEKIKTEV
jgi:hypothetical protein